MNYPVKDALAAWLQGRENAFQFGEHIDALFKTYPRENLYAMYVPLDSHDTERFKTLMGGDTNKLKLAFMFQMAFPGAPSIYYGDEIGMEGGKDPDSRRAFPWLQNKWDQDLLQWIKLLISLRKRTPSLRRGDYIRLLVEDKVYAFARILGDQNVLVALNGSAQERQLEIQCAALNWGDGRVVQSLINGQKYTIAEGKISIKLPAWSGIWVG
jgi:glycosidase